MNTVLPQVSSFSVINLRCETMNSPLGIDIVKPRLSWQIKTARRGFLQSSFQVQVSSDEGFLQNDECLLWDSGRVMSSEAVSVEYGGPAPVSRQRYTWRVRCWDQDGLASPWSEIAFWETGLLKLSDWQSKWIEPRQKPVRPEEPMDIKKILAGGAFHEAGSYEFLHPCPFLRKEFYVKGNLKYARIYVTAHGMYRLELNGKRVGDSEFTPEFTSYDQYLQYQTYDVTPHIAQGSNAIGAILADGWYAGRAGLLGDSCQYGDKLALLLQLELEYTNGKRQTVVSDSSFKTSFGPFIYSDLFMGEKYDARWEMPGWSSPSYDDSRWDSADAVDFVLDNLKAQYGEPVRAVMELAPTSVLQTPNGEWVVDMGQNVAGRMRVKAEGEAGTEIVLEHSEVLGNDGNFHNNIKGRNRNQTDKYILRGGPEEVFETTFTYHGFRYVRVSGFPGTPSITDFTGVVLSSSLRSTGSFGCSDEKLNRLQANIVWSQRGNMLSIPTDCPHRERAGWTGDIQIFAPTACFNMDMDAFLTRWLRNVVLEQKPDGQIPTIVPNMLRTYDDASLPIPGGNSSAGWGDACVIVPWVLYNTYDDVRVLQDNYDAMVKWVSFMEKAALSGPGKDSGDLEKHPSKRYLLTTGFHFGDWLVPSICDENGRPNAMQSAFITKDLVATCFFAYSSGLLGNIADILGKQEAAEAYRILSQHIREAFAMEYLQEDGTLKVDLQGIYVLALKMDMIPKDDRPKVFSRLGALIEKNNDRLDTGFVSTPFLLDVLCEHGRRDIAYRLLFQNSCPSWLYEVENGATTIWENWRAILPDGGITDVSYNHYAFGCVGDWLYRTVAGIDKGAPGFRHIVIRPEPCERLSYAWAQYDSIYGEIRTRWDKTESSMSVSVTVPPNATAEIWLRGAKANILMKNGKRVTAGDGIVSMKVFQDYALLQVGSGEFTFQYLL